jgi:two-component sensor histidine kinase
MQALTEEDYKRAARRLGCSVAAIKAVAEVEAPGSGFLPDGRPKILFERHIFRRQLIQQQVNTAVIEEEFPGLLFVGPLSDHGVQLARDWREVAAGLRERHVPQRSRPAGSVHQLPVRRGPGRRDRRPEVGRIRRTLQRPGVPQEQVRHQAGGGVQEVLAGGRMIEVDPFVGVLITLSGVGVAGFVGYVIAQNSARKEEINHLKLEHLQTRIDLLNQINANYVPSPAFTEFRNEVKTDLHQMRAILYRLADKFGIPAVLEDTDDRHAFRR